MITRKHIFYEFFAGGGMARAGLGDGWSCVFANDFDPMKNAAYSANWESRHLVPGDISNVSVEDLPGEADLAWASFPCQDLSLAGDYKGLGSAGGNRQTRSGTFWRFHEKIRALKRLGRGPRSIVLENVYGALTSNSGADFSAILLALVEVGYRVGAMVIDARYFVPQSRPRVFILAVRNDLEIPDHLVRSEPDVTWHPPALIASRQKLRRGGPNAWIWWRLPRPIEQPLRLTNIIEDEPTGVKWHTLKQTAHILGMMSAVNAAKTAAAKKSRVPMVGALYRRTRPDENGVRRQRAEVRFDNIAGCLRTPSGGSSRQSIIVVEGKRVRTRLLSSREAARLMGLPDSYKLPERYNDAYHVCGDGVVVPVVRHIARNILEPLLEANSSHASMAAE